MMDPGPTLDVFGPHLESAGNHLKQVEQAALEDVLTKFKDGKARKDTLIFRLIRGGNVELVSDVLNRLSDMHQDDVRDWVIGGVRTTLTEVGQVQENNTRCQKCYRTALRVICLAITILFTVIFSAVFYLIHALLLKLLSAMRKRISYSIDLPLAFAVLSENVKMVELFIANGVTISQVDDMGNNVFHYLADVSVDDWEKSMRCYEIILSRFDIDDIRPAVLMQESSVGYTAMENIAYYGSLRFLAKIAETEGILKITITSVTHTGVWLGPEETVNEDKEEEKIDEEASTPKLGYRLCHYDVTEYEQGDILRKQSLLLHLLGSRNFTDLDEEEVKVIHRPWIRKWMNSKIKASLFMYTFCKTCSLVCSGVFLYYLFLSNGYYITTALGPTFNRYLFDDVMKHVAALNGTISNQDMWQMQRYRSLLFMYSAAFCKQNVTKVGDLWLDECQKRAFDKVKKGCTGSSIKSLLVDTALIKSVVRQTTLDYLNLINLVFVFIQLGIDLSYRLIFLMYNFPITKGSIYQGLVVFFTRTIPGSYADLQMAVTFSVLYLFFYIFVADIMDPRLIGMNITRTEILTFIMIFLLMLQFFNIVYLFRLVPVIGLFVMTTLKLIRNLMEFMFVYIIIAIGFTCMFQFLLKNPACPAQNMKGFETVWGTLYQTFLTMLGSGNIPADFSLPVRIAYAIYCMISVVMLLNLIIAVMGHTADRVMNNPWKDALKKVDRLEEALYSEAMTESVFFPVRLCCKRQPYGLVAKDVDGQRKIYIEVDRDYH